VSVNVASWREGRWRALEDGMAWVCRAQDAGAEPAVRSINASGTWQAPNVAASGQAVALLASERVASVDAGFAARAQRVAEWTLGALTREPSTTCRLRAAAGLLDAAVEADNCALRRQVRMALQSEAFASAADPADAGLLAILRAEASGTRLAAGDLPLTFLQLAERIADSRAGLLDVIGPGRVSAERLVDLAEVLWRSSDALPPAIGRAAAQRIGRWLVDRFEVRGVLDSAYPRSDGRAVEQAPVETMIRAARVWLAIYNATAADGWFLNAALNLLDIVGVSQHRSMLHSNVTGSVPSTLGAGGSDSADGHGGATVAFLLATLAEQEALFLHALSSGSPVTGSHA
jgi:hypothetical protein